MIASRIFCRSVFSQRRVSGVRIAFAAYVAVVVAGAFAGWTQWVVLGSALDGASSAAGPLLLLTAGRAVLAGVPVILLLWRTCDDLAAAAVMSFVVLLVVAMLSLVGCAVQDHFANEAVVERSLQMSDGPTPAAVVAGPQIGRLSTTRAMANLRRACEAQELDMATMEVYIEVRPKPSAP